ncbi:MULTISPECIES: rhomboid family intramembrane serine protease [Denitromonas]|uniref:Rhomboid family intramembrane serine protease n=2 Tax=Denitromonas TaxID=139331 RepID=A0A557QXL4_9RHOO|nr:MULTISPECIES: rhomboid family intramembrane serine protease [Denitromonas]TVO57655.1 rhomboid family intramembrane serine protease [Denitromonas halophila]TVO68070.1 rhomboid family intramembrane serine protease [Denitromonas ohlonensis]TVO78025.1 rhomboid family intramembrane serine protease [Denitromonas ohlonensis]
MPPVTRALIISTVLIFLLQLNGGMVYLTPFALWPTLGNVLTAPWQLVSYSFLHGGIGHIFFNMFAVYMFGSELERVFGARRYAMLWFAGVISGALAQIAVGMLFGSQAPVIGASAGVFGLLLTYGVLFPKRRVVLLIPPIPMPAALFVALYGALELFLGVTGLQTGVAHFAHLGGMLGAGLMLRYFWSSRLRR